MYGQSSPCLIYGFNLNERNIKIDASWLENNYPSISCVASDIVKNYLGEAIYGIHCELDTITGKVTEPTEQEKQMVRELYNKYILYYKKNIGQKYINEVQLGYHLAVYGWDDEDHEEIYLDEEEDDAI